MSSRRLVVSVVLAAVATAGFGVAHAARLDVTGGQLSAFSAGRPCSAPATAVPEDPQNQHRRKFRDIRFAMPVACGGAVQLRVLENGTEIEAYAGTLAAGEAVLLNDVVNSWYTPADITLVATIEGWDLPVAWNGAPVAPAPDLAVAGCEVIDAGGAVVAGETCDLTYSADLNGDPAAWQVRVDVTTPSTTPVLWRAVVDLADTTVFPFVATSVGEYTGNFLTSAVICASGDRTVTFTGRPERGTDTVVAGAPRTIDLNAHASGTAAGSLVYACP